MGPMTWPLSATCRSITSGINAVALQPDGKIIVAAYDSYGSSNFMERLNTDGTVDNTFNVTVDLATTVSEGSAGWICTGWWILPRGMTRLDPTGATDASFQIVEGADDMVTDILLQPDGKIIVLGLFTTIMMTLIAALYAPTQMVP